MAREMKNSGVEWIGDIPSDWEVYKLKKLFYRSKEKAKQDNPVILSLARSGIKVRDMSNNDGQIAESYFDYNPVDIGDFLINPMDLYSGANCNVSYVKGVISPAYVNLKPYSNCCSRYYDYYMKTQYWAMALFAHGKGVSFDNRWTLNNETLMNYFMPYPTLKEQQKIADYLDSKCLEIDSAIEKTKQAIEEYKKYKQSVITQAVTKGLNPNAPMKESGIEWASDIPNHWKVYKGKFVLNLLSRKINDSDEVITCFRDGEVTLRKNRREAGFTFADKEIGYQGIEPGDLVIHGMDGFAGAIGISDSRGKSSPVLNVCDTNENKKYIMYYLRSMAFNNVFTSLATGIRVRSCDLRWNKLANFLYPIPPLDEQVKIVKYIDSQLESTDDIISKRQKFIEELEAYKKSLIYECVTGKKEI